MEQSRAQAYQNGLKFISSLEFLIAFLNVGTTLLSFPSGFMGDTEPTTISDILRSLVWLSIYGIFLISVFLNIKYIKITSKVLLAKILIYIYYASMIWGTFFSNLRKAEIYINLGILFFSVFITSLMFVSSWLIYNFYIQGKKA